MKLLLINPKRRNTSKGDFWDFKFEERITGQHSLLPLALPTIAGVTPKDIDVEILDEKVEPVNFDDKPDLVGIGAMTTNINRGYEIADEFRKRGVPVVIGGIHASMMPEEASVHADSIVVGEADYLWPQVISDFRNGGLQKEYRFTEYPNIQEIPVPRFDLTKSEKYVINQVQTSRGCPFDCDFCTVKAFSGQQYRMKRIEQVVSELQSLSPTYDINILGYKLKSPKTLLIADDNIVGNKSYARKLFDALKPLKLMDWYCQASINVGRDKEMLAMMKEAGCASMIIGIESVEAESLAGFDKKINKVDEYAECISNIQSAGMKVLGSFVLGSDAEDDSIFEKTAKFIKDNNIVFSMVNILTPIPGTKLYKRFEQEGRILHKDWDRYDFETVCYKPKQMSPETLQQGRRWIYREIYELDEVNKRLEKFINLKKKDEVRGFEESFGSMSFTEKVFSALMLTKIMYKINGKHRRYLMKVITDHFKGKETNFGNTIAAMSFNEYAFKIK